MLGVYEVDLDIQETLLGIHGPEPIDEDVDMDTGMWDMELEY